MKTPMRSLFYVSLLSLPLTGCTSAADRMANAIRTDSILISLHRATRYIDSARNILVAKDSAGDNERIAAAVLVHTPLGDSLRSSVLGLIDRCHSNWPNAATSADIDNAFHYSKVLVTSDYWYGQEFIGIPTASAYTLLSSMEDECTKAANFTMFRLGGHPR
jgi:hypothetical protein